MYVVLVTYVCLFVYVLFFGFGFVIVPYQKSLETMKLYFYDLSYYLYVFASCRLLIM